MSIRLSSFNEVLLKQFVLREESMKVPLDILVNLHIENPFLKPISLALADYPDLFWHSTMVATGDNNLLQKLSGGKILNGHSSELNQRAPGAFLHDIGKLGIVSGSIESSLKIMDWVPYQLDKSAPREPQTDNRFPEIRAIQHLHPLVGYEMIIQLIENGLIPRERRIKIS